MPPPQSQPASSRTNSADASPPSLQALEVQTTDTSTPFERTVSEVLFYVSGWVFLLFAWRACWLKRPPSFFIALLALGWTAAAKWEGLAWWWKIGGILVAMLVLVSVFRQDWREREEKGAKP